MNDLRERWEGVALPGDYLLERWLGGDHLAAYFETSPAPDGRRAVVKLVPESAVDAAAHFAVWQRARSLRHPNLQEVRDCGRAELGGETVAYAVFEPADDTLATALTQGPLSEGDAREVLDAVVSVLQYLESQGLTYPALDAEHVLAVGEQIKLSSDVLREAPDGAPYRDRLRAFWYQISPGSPAWRAEMLADALGETRPVPEAKVQTKAPEVVTPAPVPLDLAPPPQKGFPKWILVGAAAVVLLILGLNFRSAPETPVPPATVPAPTPIVAAPVPHASSAAEVVSKPSPLGNGKWRVIAFTYRTHDAAARKANQINERHPELEATVFSPRGKGFLISFGGPLSRQDAVSMQKKAHAAHVARDVRLENDLD